MINTCLKKGKESHALMPAELTEAHTHGLTVPYTLSDLTGLASDRLRRMRAIVALDIQYMDHPDFSQPKKYQQIMAPMPDVQDKRKRDPKETLAKAQNDPYIRDLYRVSPDSIWTREQEAHQFRKYNFIKYQCYELQYKFASGKGTNREVDRFSQLWKEQLLLKNEIITANLRLAVSLAKKWTSTSMPFQKLLDSANDSIMRAVEKFDASRGNKFSTYATWAIVKNFMRSYKKETEHNGRYRQVDEALELATKSASDQPFETDLAIAKRTIVESALSYLDERDQIIIRMRYGLGEGNRVHTLEEVGNQLGITKEGVRQIGNRAVKAFKAALFSHLQNGATDMERELIERFLDSRAVA